MSILGREHADSGMISIDSDIGLLPRTPGWPGATEHPSAEEMAWIRMAVYLEFLFGYGQAPGIDLGPPRRCTRIGTVHRQEFERGVTFANVGELAVRLDLVGIHYDVTQALVVSLLLPEHSGEVLHHHPSSG